MRTLELALVAASALASLGQDRPPLPQADDFPEALQPYVAIGEELEGLERSLTLQLAVGLGMAVERKRLPAEFRAHGEHHRDDWNEELGALLEELGPRATGGRVAGGALYLDTGMELDREAGTAQVLRKPDLRMLAAEDHASLVERRILIAGMPAGLAAEDAKRLQAILVEETGELEDRDNPWLGHAESMLMFMSFGGWDDYSGDLKAGGTPFGTFDEFMARVQKELRIALVDPLVPQLEDAERKGRNFRFEGDLRLIAHAPDDAWDVPSTVLETNALDHVAVLVIQVPELKSYASKQKLERVVIGLVAGGAHHELYDGKWPLR